jgi:integrase
VAHSVWVFQYKWQKESCRLCNHQRRPSESELAKRRAKKPYREGRSKKTYCECPQLEPKGKELASWYVGYTDPDGKRRHKSYGAGAIGKKAAQWAAKDISAKLRTGTFESVTTKKWKEFRAEYEKKVLPGLKASTRGLVSDALNTFERLVAPKFMRSINTSMLDDFISKRRQERGKKKGDPLSPATLNRDLRHLAAALKRAVKWSYLKTMPDINRVKVLHELPLYVTQEHFAMIYLACDSATQPDNMPCSPGDWWKALLVMARMTGWRISELLSLRRDDLDLERGVAVTRAESNKGGRDDSIKLGPEVVEHLKRIRWFGPTVFQWVDPDRPGRDVRSLYTQFARVQEAAGIKLACDGNHEHTRFCHVYGFHDLRRAFATHNAGKLAPTELQALMRHKSFSTTLGYIHNATRQLDAAVAKLDVPDVLKIATA